MALPDDVTLNQVNPYVPPELGTSLEAITAPAIPSAPVYTSPDAYQPTEQETVAGQMAGILSSGSPYIEGARKRGERTAQARGLLSSSLTAEYGEKAATESAFPIVSQDVKALTDAGLLAQQGEISGALGEQKYTGEGQIVGLQTEASDLLAGRESERAAKIAKFEADVAAGLLTQESADALTLDLQQQEKADERLLLTLSEEGKASYGTQITTLGTNFQTQIQNVQADPNLSQEAKTEIIDNITTFYESTMDSLADIYGVGLDYGEPEIEMTQEILDQVGITRDEFDALGVTPKEFLTGMFEEMGGVRPPETTQTPSLITPEAPNISKPEFMTQRVYDTYKANMTPEKFEEFMILSNERGW